MRLSQHQTSIGNAVSVNSAPRVRIPSSPPENPYANVCGFFICPKILTSFSYGCFAYISCGLIGIGMLPCQMLPLSVLSPKEREVAELICLGFTNRDIAKVMFISEHTVKDHTKKIYPKMGVHSRFELATLVNKHRRDDNA